MAKKSVQPEHHRVIFEYQERRAAALQKVESIEALIEEKGGLIVQAKAAIPSMADLDERRADLLADLAMGKAQPESLQALDAEIAERQQAADKAKAESKQVILTAEQTIAGLMLRLLKAQDDFKNVSAEKRELLMSFLLQEAEEIAKVYIEQAEQLRKSFLQLLALSKLREVTHQALVGKKNEDHSFTIRAFDTKISKFKLAAFGRIDGWDDAFLFNAESSQHCKVPDAVRVEEERLRSLGVELASDSKQPRILRPVAAVAAASPEPSPLTDQELRQILGPISPQLLEALQVDPEGAESIQEALSRSQANEGKARSSKRPGESAAQADSTEA